jgi:acyl-CoA reductase-like NAD-dependent aldehyde dehydrogenase
MTGSTIDEARIQQIVADAIAEMRGVASSKTALTQTASSKTEAFSAGGDDGIFPDVDSTVAAANTAFRNFRRMPLDLRVKLIAAMRRGAEEAAATLAHEAWQETGLGRYEDKIEKNLLNTRKTPGTEDLTTTAWSGDHGLTIVEWAPFGVVASITPSTNPTATVIGNSICNIAAGNAIVFNAHPAAKRCSASTVRVLNRAIQAAGGPPNLIACVAEPTIETAQALMHHKGVRVVLVTGGMAVVREAMKTGKRAICAGPGNPPIVVDESADLDIAGKGIVKGASFDNNVICTDEKEIFAVDAIADDLKRSLVAHGAIELSSWQVSRLCKAIFEEDRGPGKPGVMNKKFIGKDASVLLAEIGISAGKEARLIFAEVPREHPLVWSEQLMPALPLVRMKSADEAIDLAVQAEHGFRHTASMYSRNIEHLDRMAREIDCSIFVKNGPTLSGLGYNGEGFCSFSIAGTTGEGMTRPSTFCRPRRCTLVDAFRIV